MSTSRVGLSQWLLQGSRVVLFDLRRHWIMSVLVAAIWVLALVRLFAHHVPVLPLVFNWTPSLPYRHAWLQHGPHQLQGGDFIVFSFGGEAQRRYQGLHGMPFFKIVRGLPGDTVTVAGRQVAINGQDVGVAKTKASTHDP